jgi:hypothetical protein
VVDSLGGSEFMEESVFVIIVGLVILLAALGLGLWINSAAEQGKTIFG